MNVSNGHWRIYKNLIIAPLVIAFMCAPILVFAEVTTPIRLEGTLYSGTSIINLKNPSFDTKNVPVIGAALSPRFKYGNTLNYGIDISFQHSFKSNYNDFYYYDSYSSLSFTPNIRLCYHRQEVSFFLFAGLGFSLSFSEYFDNNFFITSAGTGIEFKKRFIQSLYLIYTHSFIKNYKIFETLTLNASIRLWDNGVLPR